jgi:membrane-bound lytic murein transglycosylase D
VSRNGLKKRGSISLRANGKPTYDNLWDRLFDLYALPAVEHQDIDRELNWFINHPSYIERVQQRAEPFLYSIVRYIEKQGVPGEIALLPVIESAFQPHAISPANAAGIWQFIPTTGKHYGLRKSRSYDGRRDVFASTRAAVKYLKKLHGDFNGDWLLAIAAYNCGEGAVSRAIQKNEARGLSTDFWSLDLPQETRSYVPRLLAVSRLFSDAGQYGVDLRPIPNQALYRAVKVKSQLDLALAADAADISLDQLFALNPGFKSQYTDLDGSYHLFVPADKSKGFKEELARLVLEQGTSGGNSMQDEVRPVQDEPLGAYAESGGDVATASAKDVIREENRGEKRRDDVIPAGDTVKTKVIDKLRDREKSKAGVLAKGSTDKPENSKRSGRAVYTVQSGDTLYSIARRNSVTVDEVMKWNKLSKKEGIRAGMTLVLADKEAARKLPISSTGAGIKPSQSIKYTVRHGDSLFGISKRFNVSVADLRKWNGPNVEKQVRPGVSLTVSASNARN